MSWKHGNPGCCDCGSTCTCNGYIVVEIGLTNCNSTPTDVVVTLQFGSTTMTLSAPNDGSYYEFVSAVGNCWTASEVGILTITGSNIVTYTQAVTLTCGMQIISPFLTQNYVEVAIFGCMGEPVPGTVSATLDGVTIVPTTFIDGHQYTQVPVISQADPSGTAWEFTIIAEYFQTLVTTPTITFGYSNCRNTFYPLAASPRNCCDCNIPMCPQLLITCDLGTVTLDWDTTGGTQGYFGYLTANVDAYPVTPGSGPFPYFTNTYGFCNTPLTPGLPVTFLFEYACFVGGQIGQIFVYYANCAVTGSGRKALQDAVAGHGGNYGYNGYTGAFSGEPVTSPVTIDSCNPLVGTAPPPLNDLYFGTFSIEEISCSYGEYGPGIMSLHVKDTYWVEPVTIEPSEKRLKWVA